MSGSAGMTGHAPRVLIQEAPTFLEEIKYVIKRYRDFEMSPTIEDEVRPRADYLIEKLDRMGIRDV